MASNPHSNGIILFWFSLKFLNAEKNTIKESIIVKNKIKYKIKIITLF